MQAQSWIPVSERLPEKNVLVRIFQAKPIKCVFDGMLDYLNGKRKWVDSKLWCVDNITHWQPIILPGQEEPEPTEFTKEWRKRFVESESFMAISGAVESQIMKEMRKACDIIEQLTDKYDRLDLYNCDMMQKYLKLQAENKKLVEGQQAKEEAGAQAMPFK